MGPGREGKKQGEEEKHILCGKRQRREREARAGRMESWAKGFGKMQGRKEEASEGEDEERVTMTLRGQT